MSKTVFLENNFMSKFLGETELICKICLAKQLHQQFYAWMREREKQGKELG
jgi:hypothetical protein